MCLAEVQSTSQSLTELSLSQLTRQARQYSITGYCTGMYLCMYIAPDYSIQCLVKSKAGEGVSCHKDTLIAN